MITRRLTRVLTALAALFMAVLLTACAGAAENSSEGAQPADRATAVGEAQPQQAPQDGTEPMIILTQTLRLKVASTTDAMDALRGLAQNSGAVVSNMRMANDDDWLYDSPGSSAALRGWATVRVPTEALEGFIAGVAGLGEVIHQAQTSDDVTQEYVDLAARVANLRAQEERLRELVAQATNVEEVLMVEEELWRVRGEIESLDAEIKYLERQSAMATVTVEFTEEDSAGGLGFQRALRDGLEAAGAMILFLVTFLIATSPLWILGVVAFFVIRGIMRRRRAAAAATPGTAQAGDSAASGRSVTAEEGEK